MANLNSLSSAAGYSGSASSDLGLDGVNQWETLTRGEEGKRTEMVYNLKVGPMSGALRVGKHKIIFGKMYNKQGWYNTDNTALQCARMGKDKKAKRKNKTKMDRMGRKLTFKKNKKKKIQGTKPKKSKTKGKIRKNKAAGSKKNKNKKKKTVTQKKKTNKQSAEKRSKKKRAKAKKREKLKRERDRKKLQRLREKKKRQKQKLQKEEERKQKKIMREKLKREKASSKKKLDQRSRENSELKARNPKKTTRREEKESSKKEKKLTKIWKDWLPLPSLEMQSLLRHRMADCNWEDFSDSGHSNTTHLIPRSDLMRGNIVEILSPMLLNPFHISAEDEASEFEEGDEREERMEARIERKFDQLDIAMYDVEADPEERNDLREELPSIFADLRERAIHHLANVVEADFPPADFSGHPRNFGGNFSPGWCQPKYL